MPSKLQAYRQMADHAATQITGSHATWTEFLTTAARLYKYPYNEQLMIFAQRPDATACAEYDFWNKRMGRYVRRGSKGIALIDTTGDRPRLKYVYDISDTGGGKNARRLNLWQYRQEHETIVTNALEAQYGISGTDGLADQLERIAAQLADEYWNDHQRDILAIVDESYLFGYDDYNVSVAFRNAATVSITYALMSRCGLRPQDYFEHEHFLSIFDWNTPDAVAELGAAVSEINQKILRQIEMAVKIFERSQGYENYERTHLYPQGGLLDPRPDAESTAGSALGQIRTDAEELPERAPSGPMEPVAALGETVSASAGDRAGGAEPVGGDDARADGGGGRDREPESQRPDEMGGTDEHLQSAGGGNHPERADFQLTPENPVQLSLFPTEAEQIAYINQAESVAHTPFAFSFAQEDIDHVLRLGGNNDHSRMRVAAEYMMQKPPEEIAAFLSREYVGGSGLVTENGRLSAWFTGDGIRLARGDAARYVPSAQIIPWQDAAARIGELLEQGQFATNVELAETDGYIRIQLAQSLWNLRRDFAEAAIEQGYLPALQDIRGNNFPDETEKLASALAQPEFLAALTEQYEEFLEAYKDAPDLLRFHYHRPDELLGRLHDLALPRREYATEMPDMPQAGRFITEDEIDAALTYGSSVEGGKGRIYGYFTEKHTPKEQAAFLKDEYGWGGHNNALPGSFHSQEDHNGKGIVIKKPECANIELPWSKVAKRITELVRKDRYLTPEEKVRYLHNEAIKAVPSSYAEYTALKEQRPDDLVLYQVGHFYEIYDEDAQTAAEFLGRGVDFRTVPDGGNRVVFRVPDNQLTQYVEHLRENFDLTVSGIDVENRSRQVYSLLSIDHEAERAIDAHEAEYGADGWRTFPGDEPVPASIRLADLKAHANYTDLIATYEELFQVPSDERITSWFGDYHLWEIRHGTPDENVVEAFDNGLAALGISQDEFFGNRDYIYRGNIVMDMCRRNNLPIPQYILDQQPDAAGQTKEEAPRQEAEAPRSAASQHELSQADIDAAIQEWNGDDASKRRVQEYMADHAREKDTAAWLRAEYGDGLPAFPVTTGYGAADLSWPKVQRRIAQLINEGRFLLESEMSPSSRAQENRYQVVVYHHLENGLDEKLEYPTLQDAEKAARGYVDGTLEDDGFAYDGAAVYDMQERKYLRIFGDYPDEAAQTQAEAPSLETAIPAEAVPPASKHGPLEPPYKVGDTVYLEGGRAFIVEKLTDMEVQLRDPTHYYPIFRAESRESFEFLLMRYPQPEKPAPEVKQPPPVAENFRITDDDLGVGGAKAKFRMNMDAINLLKELEFDGRQATPEEQEVLSRYVGWGGLADAFDGSKQNWANEFQELYATLSPEEYAAARSSTLNAHYTSPTVIRAIYEAVANMGFQTGNILEPSMGVGNFFGLLPEEMRSSKLYGVELDSITGRIAKQLYPQADITVAGFETTDRRDFFDLAIGNVPFGQYQVNDRAYNKLGFSIHNYFFAKALDQVRPGGVVAFVTSRYTMDAKDSAARKYIAQRADFLGAIRLPNNAFKANAGTEVVSDIIFLQKRDRPIEFDPEWVHLGQNEDGFAINSYFVEHPEMVLGMQTSESTQYAKQDFTVAPIPGLALAGQLADAIKNIRGTYAEAELPELGEGEAIDTSIPADPNAKNYSYTIVDGEVYFRENSRMVRLDLNETAKGRVRGMAELRDCVRQLIDLQMDEYTPDSAIREKQAELNRLYDAFSAKYGLINDRGNKLAFADDSSYYLLCSLEVLDDDNHFKRKADMFTKRTIRQQHSVTSVDTASEALAVSIGEKACVDLGFMASLMGGSEKIPQIVEDLRGVIYKTPGSGPFDLEAGGAHWAQGWKTADEYLSGNVRQKLREAKRAAEQDPMFQINVAALEKAQPKDLDASEIEVRLGATWIDKEYIQQFMEETFDTPWHLRRSIQVHYSAYTAEWNITGKGAVGYNNIAATVTYGTERANAYRILEDSLNLRDVRIYDTVQDPDGKERRVLNAKETTLAAQKQQAIRDAFKDWLWRDPERRQTLVRQYNEEMNSTRPREYDGSHIVFSGMNPEITLREHQKNAIAHVLYGGNTLLAHEVGAGKTFEMVAACMESKRLGLSQKSIFVVPNHLTEQWASEFLRLYPSANLLVTSKKDFETRNRKKFCSRIATGDYDAVIIGHSQFERVPISAQRQERLLQEQIWEITKGIEEVEASGGERFTVKQLERTRKGLEARLEKLQANDRKDDVVTFEQLGCDRMFVDESDNYKNLFLYTKMRNVAGLSTTDAQKSSDMFAKCRYMDELTGNRGVVFATGTPISNSMTEMYTIQRYLQYDRLQEMGMAHFDCWASRFGETVTALELAPEGTGYRARTRFSKFFNLPELMNMFKEVADIKTADQLDLPTPEVEYHTIASKPTEHQQAMVKALSERAAKVHAGRVEPNVDNMLKITSDGRKLGLDQRIINAMLPDEPGTKVNECVGNILHFWREGEADKLTQLVFCDISTPRATPSRRAAKAPGGNLDSTEIHALETDIGLPELEAAFTVYEDIRQKLIARGVPAEQVAFIHEANTDMRKKELFGKVRSGQVRVLIGSTQKMGAGTNVQDRLIAIHDLDCPWRPRDLTQRKGRIERQGNQNEKVHVCRYVTEGTFDAYLWQTVENKQKFISQIMSSKSPVRSCDDVDETALSFAEIKALCAGDPRIKERMDLEVDVSRLKIMKADHQSKQFRMEDNLLKYFPEKIEQSKGYIRGLEADMKILAEHPHPTDGFAGMEVRGDKLTDKENAGAALLDAVKEVKGSDPVQIGSYRGFAMSVQFDPLEKHYELTLRGSMTHRATLGSDPRGNLVRIDNVLDRMPERLKDVRVQLENLHQQKAAAQAESGKPFPQEEELRVKTGRLIELDTILNTDNRSGQPEQAIAKSARPSVLDKLKAPCRSGAPGKSHKQELEVR